MCYIQLKFTKIKKLNSHFCLNFILLSINVSLNSLLLDNIKKTLGVKHPLNSKHFNNYISFIFHNKKNSSLYNEMCLLWTLKMSY